MTETAPDEIDLLPPDVPQLRRLRRKKDTIAFLEAFLAWAKENHRDSGITGPPAEWDVNKAILGYLRIDAVKVQEEEAAMTAYLQRIQVHLEQLQGPAKVQSTLPSDSA